jgi:tetratricopeptide (TPR) repeat protein
MNQQRIYDFFVADSKSRWRASSVSIGVGTIVGAVSAISGDGRALTLGATIATTSIAYILQVWLYGRKTSATPANPTPYPYRLKAMGIALATLTALVVLFSIPASSVEAAILNRRLQALTDGGVLGNDRAKTIKNCLDFATERAVSLSPTTMTQVSKTIRESVTQNPNSPSVLGAASSLVEYSKKTNSPGWSSLGRFIIEIGTLSFPLSQRQEHLQEIIDLATAALLANPPDTLGIPQDPRLYVGDDVRETAMLYIDLVDERANAYYDAGQFANAIVDCQYGLRLSTPKALWVPSLFRIMVASYLHLGRVDKALEASGEYQQRVGDSRLLKILEANRSDPDRALAEVLKQWPDLR